MSMTPFTSGNLARIAQMSPFSRHWGRQRDLNLPGWESGTVDLKSENNTDFSTPTSDRADLHYYEQLLGLRDVRHLNTEEQGRRTKLLKGLTHFIRRTGPATYYSAVPTSDTFSDTSSYPLIRYLVLRTAGYLQSAAFQSDDYARPLESEALRAWARNQGLSSTEFQLLCQLETQVEADEASVQGIHPKFLRLKNASRIRQRGAGSLSGLQSLDEELAEVSVAS